VEKETNGCVGQPVTQHSGKQHQVVVVHPNYVVRFVTIDNCFAEDTICFDICIPAFCFKFQLRGEVVKDWPECLIGVALVESCCHFFWQVNCETAFIFRPLCKNSAAGLSIFLFSATSSPTDPVPIACSEQSIHRACEASGATLGRPTILGSPQSKRESV
jgi:hypothetical protein